MRRRLLATLGGMAACVLLAGEAQSQQPKRRVITLSSFGHWSRTRLGTTLDRASRSRMSLSLADCYADAVAQQPEPSGSVRLFARVDGSGGSRKVDGSRSPRIPHELFACAREQLRDAPHLPPESGGLVTVRQDVVFAPWPSAWEPRVVESTATALDVDWGPHDAPGIPLVVQGSRQEPIAALIRRLRDDVAHCRSVQPMPRTVAIALTAVPDGSARDLAVTPDPPSEPVASCLKNRIATSSLPRPPERAWAVSLRFVVRSGGIYLDRE
jgi:hypothetical protein